VTGNIAWPILAIREISLALSGLVLDWHDAWKEEKQDEIRQQHIVLPKARFRAVNRCKSSSDLNQV